MTAKQIERLRKKIDDIKHILAAEKKKFGGYDDSRGLRYVPLQFFMQLEDYRGGLTYTKWFHKNFPDDRGFPVFLFEWSVILFKNNDIKGAEKKALESFFLNPYLFDKYFEQPFSKSPQTDEEKWQQDSLEKGFPYSKNQPGLADFSDWLSQFIQSEKFNRLANRYKEIEQGLQTESVGRTRSALVKERRAILDDYE